MVKVLLTYNKLKSKIYTRNDETGETRTFLDLVDVKNQGENSSFEFYIDYENGTGGVLANGFKYHTHDINENNVLGLLPSKSALSENATDFAKTNDVKLETRTSGKVTDTSRAITTKFTEDSIAALDSSALKFADQYYKNADVKGDYQAVLLDAVYGTHRERANATDEQ